MRRSLKAELQPLFADSAAPLFLLFLFLVLKDRLIFGHDRIGDHGVRIDAEVLGIFLAINGQYNAIGAGANGCQSAESSPASAGEPSATFAAAARSAFGRARG